MKIHLNKNNIVGFMMALALSAFLVSCTKNTDANDRTYNITGNASGGQQVPSVTTSGTGSLSGTYNMATNTWQYTIEWSALSSPAAAVEIHGPAGSGINAELLLGLTITAPGTTGSASGTVTLTDEQEDYLLSGQLYYTVLTATHITGEIRGQILVSIQ